MENEKENRTSPNQVMVGDVLRLTESGKVGQGDTHLEPRPGRAVSAPDFTVVAEVEPDDRQEGFVDEQMKDQPNAEPPDPLTLSDEEMLTEPN